MKKEEALVDKEYLLQKFPGKGGWTYAALPEIAPDRKKPFGWVTVKGTIDGYELKKFKLMPMGNGSLFLPVKAAIRKKIGKEAGAYVKIKLFLDDTPLEVTEEIWKCFENEPPKVYNNFIDLSEGEQKAYLDWIYKAKMEETKAERILKMMSMLREGLKFYGGKKKRA